MTPAVLRTLAGGLRGAAARVEDPLAAELLHAAAALDGAADLWRAADGVVRSYDAGYGPRWSAIETLNEVLRELEGRR